MFSFHCFVKVPPTMARILEELKISPIKLAVQRCTSISLFHSMHENLHHANWHCHRQWSSQNTAQSVSPLNVQQKESALKSVQGFIEAVIVYRCFSHNSKRFGYFTSWEYVCSRKAKNTSDFPCATTLHLFNVFGTVKFAKWNRFHQTLIIALGLQQRFRFVKSQHFSQRLHPWSC